MWIRWDLMKREFGKNKKQRITYLIIFVLLLVVEICIGAFVHDAFVRPYVGDMLVTVLLCCLCRIVFPRLAPTIPVFIFALLAEGLQGAGLVEKLGLQGTIFEILLGATFDWKDIVCYALGCVVFAAAEVLVKRCWKRER